MAPEYGDNPPWHDIMAAISGPAVYDVETVFRERWEDPTRLTRHPVYWTQDKILRLDMSPDPLPAQWPPPPSPPDATHTVQLLRTYPNLRRGRDYPFARGGERSVARGYSKALLKARDLVYVEDQYVWGRQVGEVFTEALERNPDLHVVAVVPLFTDQDGFLGRVPQKLGRLRAMQEIMEVAPERVASYGIENHEGTPVYVHAKVCVMDDVWASIGSDNFNRRSWTHDSELSCVVVDDSASDHSPYARRLRLTLAAEHLDREVDESSLLDVMSDCLDGPGLFAAYAESAERLDAWHDDGRVGERPPGRLRRLQPPELTRLERLAALVPYLTLHDPDGRPGASQEVRRLLRPTAVSQGRNPNCRLAQVASCARRQDACLPWETGGPQWQAVTVTSTCMPGMARAETSVAMPPAGTTPASANRFTSSAWPWLEVVLQVGGVDVVADHVGQGHPGGVEHRLDVVHRVPRLSGDVALVDEVAVGVDGTLPGGVQGLARLDDEHALGVAVAGPARSRG